MKPRSTQLLIPTLKLFTYADPGGGKTTFFATAMDDPRTSPALWLDCGGNPESIRRRNPVPDMIEIETTTDLNPIYEYLKGGQRPEHSFAKTLFGAGPNDFGFTQKTYKTVVFDGVTEYQRVAFDEITGNASKRLGDKLNPPDQRMFGQALSRLTMVARYMFGLPGISVLISALERQDKDETTGALSFSPNLWGQARSEVPAYSLLTARLIRQSKLKPSERDKAENKNAYTIAYFDQTGSFLAKDQYGGLPSTMPDPTIPKVMDAAYGQVTA